MLRHYPLEDISFAVLAVGENAAWRPIKAIDAAVRRLWPPGGGRRAGADASHGSRGAK